MTSTEAELAIVITSLPDSGPEEEHRPNRARAVIEQGRLGANLHIGLVGAGRIGTFHAHTLRADARVERLTITDIDPSRATVLAQELQAGHAATVPALIEAGIEALVIAAATPAHVELLHLAADMRVPAFCEKPIALELAETDRVIDHVSRSRTFVQMGFQRRFDSGYRAVRQAVTSGATGPVHLIRLATHDPVPPPEMYLADSGGIWLDLAIHDFDVASWVLGREVVEVYADGQANDAMFQRQDDVDAACALLRFDGGELGVLTAARNDPRGYDVRMEVFGRRDSLAVGVDPRTPLLSVEPGVTVSPEPGYRDFIDRFQAAYRAEMTAFVDAIVSGAESPCTVDDARRALVVALAVGRSRRERRPVRIEEIS